jgi:hypothetical protein
VRCTETKQWRATFKQVTVACCHQTADEVNAVTREIMNCNVNKMQWRVVKQTKIHQNAHTRLSDVRGI